MDVLYLLIPLSVLLVLMIVGVFAWAINNGQLDDLEREGARMFEDDSELDLEQVSRERGGKQSVNWPQGREHLP